MYSTETLEQITIEPTSYCNARCPQCDRFDEKNNLIVPLQHLDVGILQSRLDPRSLPNLRKVELEGAVGDVLSHNNPLGLMLVFRDVTEVVMWTNGSVRNADFFRGLAQFKNTELVFSVDGLNDTNHLYRQSCNFEKIMSNAEAYIGAGGNASWKFIVFKHNEHQVEQARELSKRMGFRRFETVHSDRSWHHGNKWPVYNNNEYQFDLEPSSVFNNATLESDHSSLNSRLADIYRQNRSIKQCPEAAKKRIFIDYAGNVIPCCMLQSDLWTENFNTKFLMKHVKDLDRISLHNHTIHEIFQGEFYQRDLPQSLANKPMPKCLLYCAEQSHLSKSGL